MLKKEYLGNDNGRTIPPPSEGGSTYPKLTTFTLSKPLSAAGQRAVLRLFDQKKLPQGAHCWTIFNGPNFQDSNSALTINQKLGLIKCDSRECGWATSQGRTRLTLM